MPIKADLEGNLTKDPEGRTVKVDGEPRKIVEIRVFSDVNRLVGDRYEQDADKSGGVDVTIWREGLGDAVLAHFRKGARVWVTGDLHLHRYKDRESGEPRAALRMTADNVALLPYRMRPHCLRAQAQCSRRFRPGRSSGEPDRCGRRGAVLNLWARFNRRLGGIGPSGWCGDPGA